MSAPTAKARFLDHFQPQCHGRVANWFYDAVRSGCSEPRAVCSHVFRTLSERAKTGRISPNSCDEPILSQMTRDREGALALAAEVIARERLPPDERSQQKQQTAESGRREWMARQPATEKQIALLRKLGFTEEIHNRLHASEMIETLKDW